MFIDQSGLAYWTAPRGTTSTTSPNGTTLQAARYLQPAAGPGLTSTSGKPASPLYATTPTISDQSIYDWSSINLSAPNSFTDRTITTNIAIDQIIIDTAMQTLAVQGAFMREDSTRWTRNMIGIANDNGQSGQLTVDINERLLDGTRNPFFLRPYISVDRPRIVDAPAVWDTSRAQLAYRLDLTHEKNWIQWLGSHQFTAYVEKKHRVNRQYSYREGITNSDTPWLASTVYRGFQSAPSLNPTLAVGSTITPANPYTANRLAQNAYRFYVGNRVDQGGINVDYAPSDIRYGTYNYFWGNATVGALAVQPLTLGQIAADKTGGTFNTDTTIKTAGAVIQSHFIGDRLTTTFGLREDRVTTKFGALGIPWTGTYTAPAALVGTTYSGILQNTYLNADGMTFNRDVTDAWGSSYSTKGRTTNVQFMLRPFMNTGVVTSLEKGNGLSGFLGDVLKGLSVFTNRSDSFLPIAPSQDLYKNALPDTTGTDKSWGIGLNLMEGKLYIRFTRYDNLQRNAQNGDMSTMAGRVLRLDMQTLGAGNPTPMLNLHDDMVHAVRYVAANPALASQYPTYVVGAGDTVDSVVARLTKLSASDINYYSAANPPIASTVDTRSVGSEVEVNYNPTRYWTVSASVTDNQTINSNVSPALIQWIAERTPVWTTLVDPSITTANATAEGNPNKLWWLHHYATNTAAPYTNAADWLPTQVAPYRASDPTPQSNYQTFVQVPFTLMRNLEGKSNPQIRRYAARFSTSYQLAGITENTWLKRVTVGGAYRWEDKGAIGYNALSDIELDVNNPIYDRPHGYVDMFVSYKTKLWKDKVSATFKVNVKNVGEGGRLQPVASFPDGSISTYRIIDPQQFIFSASFDL